MSNSITIQREQLVSALLYLRTIETADEKIKLGIHVNYFKACRAEAIERYAETMSDVMKEIIIVSKVLIPVA